MTHPDDGTLRLAADGGEHAARVGGHLAACPRCRGRMERIRQDAGFAGDVLSVEAMDLPTEARRPLQAGVARRSLWQTWGARTGAIAGAVTAVVAVLAFTPLGSMAANLLNVFQPKAFVAVPVTRSDATDVAAVLSHLGTVQGNMGVKVEPMAGAAQAAAAAGFGLAEPATLPAGTVGTPRFAVVPAETLSFTFSEAKAARWEAAQGQSLPSMPAGLDGATLTVATHPVSMAVWQSAAGEAPTLLVAASPLPSTTSTGPTVTEIEQYVASLPGVPSGVAAEILALQNPASTLPIPIPQGTGSGASVSVNGHAGLLVQVAGFGGAVGPAGGTAPTQSNLQAVVWEEGGMIHLVAGQVGDAALLKVATSLG